MQIYTCKFQMVESKLEGFLKRIENVYNIEKYIVTKNNKTHIFNPKRFIENAADDPEIQ